MTSKKRTSDSSMNGNDDTKRIKLINDEMTFNAKDYECADSTPVERFTSFPERLMQMLDSDNFTDIIYWSGYGDSFCISTKEFIEKVLGVYFEGSKFESFVRKLNRWGFRRTYHPDFHSETIGYQHPMFRKGRPELLTNLSNKKKQQKTPIPSTPKQGAPLVKVIEPNSTMKMAGTFKKNLYAAPALKTNALQGQQEATFYQPMVQTEASQVIFCEVLLDKQQVSQLSSPMQYRKQPIASMLASSRQPHLQHEHKQHLQQLLNECLSPMTLFHQPLPLPHNPTALDRLRSGNGLVPLSILPTLPTAQLAAEALFRSERPAYKVIVCQPGQLHYPIF